MGVCVGEWVGGWVGGCVGGWVGFRQVGGQYTAMATRTSVKSITSRKRN